MKDLVPVLSAVGKSVVVRAVLIAAVMALWAWTGGDTAREAIRYAIPVFIARAGIEGGVDLVRAGKGNISDGDVSEAIRKNR